MDRIVKPVHMALCRRCADGIRQTYSERADEKGGREPGVCGYCGMPAEVSRFDLWPKQRKVFRPRAGGGERSRAGAR